MMRSKAKKLRTYPAPPPSPCPNCTENGPHFVPPSFGEPGFWTCGMRTKEPLP
jgi:hypothetical protein